MIAVIGTKSTNELIKSVIGSSRKNYDIGYFDYTNTAQIPKIVTEHSEIEGILFSGLVGLKSYEEQGTKPNIPYEMVTIDNLNFVLGLLSLVLEYKEIDVSRIYMDYIGFLRKYQKEFLDILPSSFTDYIKGFEFENLSEMTRENIYEDIRVKYENDEIDVAIVFVAKISKELDTLGITYKADYLVLDEYVIGSYNTLVKAIEQQKINNQKHYSGVLYVRKSECKDAGLKCLKAFEDQLRISNLIADEHSFRFEIKPDEIYIRPEKVLCKMIETIMDELHDDLNIGIGIGRTRIESEHHALKAYKYAKAYGNRKHFIMTEEKLVMGPLNDEYSLSVNEYQLEARYEQARSLGIKGFNLCRLLALYEKKKLLNTEIVMSYLNIAHRSSNRILTILERNGIVEEGYERSTNRVGRPSKKYRLIT